ncbi:hypothetical protein DACRYDRAFT_14867 [Dacryopinax primogenitus]|uniref:Uncharacterized protein n=1 Tax=Dacryopinax primogenitus (strain DJM 731) TaxID=1858805 RepID=M5G6Q2_DACPD|nr:uncharacterized protein DACRYDRAFT_14867 [Dacryopinax primogenitus]EJU03885.1 hypothetical protein DACRYDRAFT_14867 [Dacryopinax primogenitus]
MATPTPAPTSHTPGRVRFLSPVAAHTPASTSTASATSSASTQPDSSSFLLFLTTQLQSHGFLPPSSSLSSLLSLPEEQQTVIEKCLHTLLQQRVEDMARLEEVGAGLRTAEWERGRWRARYEEETCGKDRAEREGEAKSARLAALTKSLQTEQTAHKQTSSHLTRAQSTLQTVRGHAQAELRKRDKEVERMAERWQRIAAEQARLGALGSGMRVDLPLTASTLSIPTDSLLETQLQETESHRVRLVEENDALRATLLVTARALQSLLNPSEPPILPSALFTPELVFSDSPEFQARNARSKLLELCHSISDRLAAQPSSFASLQAQSSNEELETAKDEVRRLAENIKRVEEELAEARGREERGQRLMEQYALQATKGRASDAFLDDPDTTRRRALTEEAQLLQQDRAQLTEAAVQLGKERAQLQRERQELDEEKRKAALKAILEDLPPTPVPWKEAESLVAELSRGGARFGMPGMGGWTTSTPAPALLGFAHAIDEDELESPSAVQYPPPSMLEQPSSPPRTPSPIRAHRRRAKRQSLSPATSHTHKRTSLGGSKTRKSNKSSKPIFPRKSALALKDYRPIVGSPLKQVTTLAEGDSSGSVRVAAVPLKAEKVTKGRKEKENDPPPVVSNHPPLAVGQALRASTLQGNPNGLRASTQRSADPKAARESTGLKGGRDSLRLSARDLLPLPGAGRRKSVLGGGAQRVWRGSDLWVAGFVIA